MNPRHLARLAPALAVPVALLLPSAALGAPLPASAPAAVPADDATGDSSLLLMLDASGSMKKDDPSGLTKIEAAKKALTAVVDALPDDADVGLRVYGATVDSQGEPTKAACADTQLAVPVGPLDRTALTSAIKGFTAVGETPIAHSLDQALGDLPDTGKRTIVMVSDGQESCVPDPCPVVEKLVGSGIDLRIDTVGFAVDTKARTQLQCIAAAGGGTYYDADDADQLTTNLTRISVRAAREFGVTGTRVTGSLDTEQGAPVLTAGQYVDTFTTGEGTRHYVLKRTIANSTLHVAVTARPGVDLDDRAENDDKIEFTALDDDGRSCTSLPGRASRIGLSSLAYVITDSLAVEGGTAEEPGDCGASMEVPLEIVRDGGADPVDAELLVVEEPPVADADALPAPAEELDADPAELGRATPVVGGTSLGDATPVTPGTWTEQYVSGETIFYRVPVDWGQTLTLTVATVLADDDGRTGPLFDANLYDPTRGLVEPGNLAPVGRQDARVVRETAAVRYRNREDFPIRFSSLAGQYYIAISVPKVDTDTTVPMDVTFRVDVTGEVSGAPEYVGTAASAAATSTASPTATTSSTPVAAPPPGTTDDRSSGVPLWVWLAGGTVLVLFLVVGAAVVLSRRETPTG